MTASAEPRVIVVDDDDAVRDSLSLVLETRGYEVATFTSGPEFLAALKPDWRGCLLLDVRMPTMDGLEVQQQLIGAESRLAVIIMTAHGDVPIAVKAMKAGAVDFLEKPIEPERLFEAVRVAIQSGGGQRSLAPAGEDLLPIRKCYATLTDRERDVLVRLVKGLSNKVIAYELTISPRTVELHRARVMQKMEAQSLSHLVRMALQIGVEP